MNELLAPLYYQFENDSNDFFHETVESNLISILAL